MEGQQSVAHCVFSGVYTGMAMLPPPHNFGGPLSCPGFRTQKCIFTCAPTMLLVKQVLFLAASVRVCMCVCVCLSICLYDRAKLKTY